MDKDFFKLITEGNIIIEYWEDEDNNNEGQISIQMADELEKSLSDDMFEELLNYIQDCLIIASYAGFEAPTKFYRDIKKFVESGDPLAKTKN